MSRLVTISAVSSAVLGAALAADAAEPDSASVVFDVPAFAETEPEIDFPTCIGIARIEAGAVTTIPIAEGQIWDEQFDLLGEAVGRTVEVLTTDSADPAQAVADIRADGQAAGLDYVVIYEVAYDDAEGAGATAIQRLQVFPTFEGEESGEPARAAGAAILLDVTDGSMYGIASATTIDNEIEQGGGAYGGEGPQGQAFAAVVAELAHEVETAFVGIMIKAGLPAPQTVEVEGDIADLTQEQIIAMADREIQAAYEDQAGEPGC